MNDQSSAAARHARASELFLACLELDSSERDAWLMRACHGNHELRAAVDELRRHDALTRGSGADPLDALARPAGLAGLPALGAFTASSSPALPRDIDGHRVLDVLGSGGTGVVYRVRQENPPRELALKLLHPALAAPDVRRRFAREAAVLARLSHAGIAQIHGAGEFSGDGEARPYLLMELVHGRPLVRYAREERLTLADRAALLERVCDALEHAHDHGVVHRDIKSPNVLVTESGQPKIVDFGAARLVGPRADTAHAASMAGPPRDAQPECSPVDLTHVGHVVGSLATMSPEQLEAGAGGIDRRADVYALGVLAFELCAGKPPYDLDGRSVAEALDVLRHGRPRLGRVDRRLRGDLESVVAQAMEPDRADRYESARAFAADLRAWRAGRPVRARRPARVELAWRVVRAHPLLALALLGLFATGGLLLQRETAFASERAAAARFYREANEDIAGFVNSTSAAALPGNETVLEMLRRAGPTFARLVRIDAGRASAFAGFVARSLRTRFGDQRALAEEYFDHAVVQAERAWGPTHPRTLAARYDQAASLLEQRRLDDAGAALTRLSERTHGVPEHGAFMLRLKLLRARHHRQRAEFGEQRRLLEDVTRHADEVLGQTAPETIDAHMSLARLELSEGNLTRGEALVTQLRARLGADHPAARAVQVGWSRALAACAARTPQKQPAPLLDWIASRRSTHGDCDPGLIDTVLALVLQLQRAAAFTEALRWARLEPLDCDLSRVGVSQRLALRRYEGINLQRLGRHVEAERVLLSALDELADCSAVAPAEHRGIWFEIAEARLSVGRFEAARRATRCIEDLEREHSMSPATSVRLARLNEHIDAALASGLGISADA